MPRARRKNSASASSRPDGRAVAALDVVGVRFQVRVSRRSPPAATEAGSGSADSASVFCASGRDQDLSVDRRRAAMLVDHTLSGFGARCNVEAAHGVDQHGRVGHAGRHRPDRRRQDDRALAHPSCGQLLLASTSCRTRPAAGIERESPDRRRRAQSWPPPPSRQGMDGDIRLRHEWCSGRKCVRRCGSGDLRRPRWSEAAGRVRPEWRSTRVASAIVCRARPAKPRRMRHCRRAAHADDTRPR